LLRFLYLSSPRLAVPLLGADYTSCVAITPGQCTKTRYVIGISLLIRVLTTSQLESLVSPSSSEASTPELVQTPRLSTELLDVDAEPFSVRPVSHALLERNILVTPLCQRSFSGLFDVYEQYGGGGGENIDDIDDDEAALIYGLERNVILTATLARRLHIPPKKKQSSRVSIGDEVYRMNMTYDTEVYHYLTRYHNASSSCFTAIPQPP
jgi:hypothetical protein